MSTEQSRVAAASLGGALEWFDQILYGVFAANIAEEFFPVPDRNMALLIAFGTFGAAFFFRPLGGVVIGAYADKAGRKPALLLTMSLMLIGTATIAVTPPYSSIGMLAPVIVVFGRLLQGFSAGGEFGSAAAFLLEQTPKRRGFYSSWQFASQGVAIWLAGGVGVIISTWLPHAQLSAWGWRIPFLIGLLIGPMALYIRRNVGETGEFMKANAVASPLLATIKAHSADLLQGAGTVILATVAIYILLYLPTYSEHVLGLKPGDGFVATFLGGMVISVGTPISGLLSDRFGPIIVSMVSALAMVTISIPLFTLLVLFPGIKGLWSVELLVALFTAGYLGGLASLLGDLFPVRNRAVGISLTYNVAVTVFGGLSPATMTWLTSKESLRAAPGYYLAFAALLSAGALGVALRRGHR